MTQELAGIEGLEGAVYGPSAYHTDRRMVSAYVAATGDDPARWVTAGPPSLAGALLFGVAPQLLSDPRAGEWTRSVVHGDQSFTWHQPVPIDVELSVTGTVSRVRERGGIAFVSFDTEIRQEDLPIISGTSTFLMSGGAPPAGSTEEEPEPSPLDGSNLEPVAPAELRDGALPSLGRAVSRSDLVKYAAASGDFNPIHWDHSAAVAAGLPGVVAHGLLQTAWLCQYGARFNSGDRPIASARFRYRLPLRPAVPVRIVGEAAGKSLKVAMDSAFGSLVSATMELA